MLWAAPVWAERKETCTVRVLANLQGPLPSLNLREKYSDFSCAPRQGTG